MDGNPHPHNPGPLTGDIPQQFAQHEERSQKRYEMLAEQIKQTQQSTGEKMGENVSEKTIVNVDGGRGGSDSGSIAAIIAAMNSGGGNDALPAMIAAMNNNRPTDGGMAALAPLLAGMNNNSMNGMLPLLAILFLLGRGRGGFLGGDGDACAPGGIGAGHAALLQTLLEGQSALRAEVPTTGLQTQNAVLGAIAQLALGNQQGFANVKDSVQTGNAFLDRDIQMVNQNVSAQGCETREVVLAAEQRILSRIDRSEIDTLRDRLNRTEREVEINTLRSQVEVNQTVNQTQAQGQGQFQIQRQIDDVAATLRELRGLAIIGNQTMLARQAQDIVNLGTMTASGTQASANTQVR